MGRTTEALRQEATVPAPPPVDPVTRWQGLSVAAVVAGVPLDDDQLARFDAYRRLLLDRAGRVNLTAITDPDEVDRRLFLDALLMVPAVDRLIAALPKGRARMVDVGSGAGFPGLALKIARPDLRMTLVEATGKKVAFLTETVKTLGLYDVDVISARAEDLGHHPDHRGAHDLATARAVASLPALLELCAPLLRVGGSALFPKGAAIGAELDAARCAGPLLGVRLAGVERVADGTQLVLVEKTSPTPSRYPRRAGLPARDPLGVHRDGQLREDGRGRTTR